MTPNIQKISCLIRLRLGLLIHSGVSLVKSKVFIESLIDFSILIGARAFTADTLIQKSHSEELIVSDLLDKIIRAFHNPLAAMMFFIGAVLILIGLTDGIPLFDNNTIQTTDNFRYLSVALGVFALIASTFVYYKPPARDINYPDDPVHPHDDTTENIMHPVKSGVAELAMSWAQKRDILSQTQRHLLAYIEQRNSVSYVTLLNNFSEKTNNEMFYRLEQLRLLGFVVCEQVGRDSPDASNILYTLSESYESEISNSPHVANTLFAG
jgi:hypothetical protein